MDATKTKRRSRQYDVIHDIHPKRPVTARQAEAAQPEAEQKPVKISWLKRHQHGLLRWLTLGGGAAIVTLWTVIRHISNGINYDVVGQIGIASQWAHGIHAGAQVGPTNYLLKMPLYFAINAISALSPMHKLLVLALICNLATFVLLFILMEKFLKLYGVLERSWLYLGMAWLATIAGGVYWMDYANSRNLETVGGITFVYLVLSFIKRRRPLTLLWLLLTTTLLFFADPLECYILAPAVFVYVSYRWLKDRHLLAFRDAFLILSMTAFGYFGSLDLFALARTWLHISFLNIPNPRQPLNLHTLFLSIKGIGISTLATFDADFLKAPLSPNTLRTALNGLVLVALVLLCVRVFKKRHRNKLIVVLPLAILANYGIYLASGQATQSNTSRYLVMVPLLLLAFFLLSVRSVAPRWRLRLQLSWLLIIMASTVLLAGALVVHWPDRHSKDQYIYRTVAFVQTEKYPYAIASRPLAVPGTYFAANKATILPTICTPDHVLHVSELFFDHEAVVQFSHYSGTVPILLQSAITSGANHCTQQDIMRQFGIPLTTADYPGIGAIDFYPAQTIQAHIIEIARLLGPHKTPSLKKKATPAPITVVQDSTLSAFATCDAGATDVVVAHPDDDILFMNPSLLRQISDKQCVRTVFVTAADDGRTASYWLGRQAGIEAAYAAMANVPDQWVNEMVSINGHQILSRILQTDPSIRLLFLRLPDGNIKGQGFKSTNYESLEKLTMHNISVMHAVDGSTQYSYTDLENVIRSVFMTDQPKQIYTQLNAGRLSVGDHSDHRMVGTIVLLSRNVLQPSPPISMFVGYPSGHLPINIAPADAVLKQTIFLAYAHGDQAICDTGNNCSNEKTYQNYFSRSYEMDR